MMKTGFIYVWYDTWRKMFYVGCHWGTECDGYICSSRRMRKAYRRRPQDFRRRIIQRNIQREQLLEEEYKWISLIPDSQLGKKYYNISKKHFGHWSNDPASITSVREKIKQSLANPETKQRHRESKLGDKNPMKRPEVVMKRTQKYKEGNHSAWNKGKKLGPNPEHSKRMKGRPSPKKGSNVSEEAKNKISKTWLITTPEGEQIHIINLNSWCKEQGITAENLRNTAYGRRRHASGYSAILVETQS